MCSRDTVARIAEAAGAEVPKPLGHNSVIALTLTPDGQTTLTLYNGETLRPICPIGCRRRSSLPPPESPSTDAVYA